jgi:hypothetical protein
VIERSRAWRRRAAPWLLLAAAAGLGGCVQAPVVPRPMVPVASPRSPWDGHPRLIAAARAIDAQIAQLRAARNGDDGFGGHRRRAIELALQARAEVYRAAVYADRHR